MRMKYSSLFTKQKMMRTVLIALIPVMLVSVYFFGWRHLVMGLVVAFAGALSEYLIMRSINKEKAKISEAVFVSAALFTLSLPPLIPMWIAVVGMVFAMVFAKAAFGGFGRNIFNPALVGRCFIYIAFPAQMTLQWPLPYNAFPGGFAAWSAARGADAISSATPLITLNAGGAAAPTLNLFLGNIAGSLGETSAVLILLGAAFLLYKKVASWRLMLSTLTGAGIFAAVLWLAGVSAATPWFVLFSGGLMFGAVFMVTDPVSAPKDKALQWLAGFLVGSITVIIRTFGLFTEGMMFAVLIVNALTPLLELKYRELKESKKAKAKGAAA
jgi:Na+-transporting NADH:ubiquinone oxidoreductase subunit B